MPSATTSSISDKSHSMASARRQLPPFTARQRPPPGDGADDSEQSRQLGRRRQPHCTAENRAAEHQAHSRLPIARRRQRTAKTSCGQAALGQGPLP